MALRLSCAGNILFRQVTQPSANAFPEDPIADVIAISGNVQALRVCTAWHRQRDVYYRSLLESYLADPKIKAYVPVQSISAEATHDEIVQIIQHTRRAVMDRTRTKYMEVFVAEMKPTASVVDLRALIDVVEEMNLVIFFACVLQAIDELDPPVRRQDKPLEIMKVLHAGVRVRLSNSKTLHAVATAINSWLDSHQFVLDHIEHLNCERAGLTQLPPKIGKLHHLITLNLSHNRLAALPPDIASLRELLALVLDHNEFETFPAQIPHLSTLQILRLNQNRLSRLPDEMRFLIDLRVLDLGNNQLAVLSRCVCELRQLEQLGLASNQLIDLPGEMRHLSRLQRLVLEHNELDACPPSLCEITSLTELFLNGNELEELPPEFGALHQLVVLCLGANRLSALPRSFGELNALTLLTLVDNAFEEFPGELCRLGNLRALDLKGNKIRRIPPEIGQMAALKRLFIELDHGAVLPPEIYQLTNLRHCEVSGVSLSLAQRMQLVARTLFNRLSDSTWQHAEGLTVGMIGRTVRLFRSLRALQVSHQTANGVATLLMIAAVNGMSHGGVFEDLLLLNLSQYRKIFAIIFGLGAAHWFASRRR